MGHSSGLALAAVLFSFGLAHSAHAQNAAGIFQEGLQRKYDLLQQQADTDRMNAETERRRLQLQTDMIKDSAPHTVKEFSSSTMTVGLGDSLANYPAAAYLLQNGVTLRTTGIFYPPSGATCVAFCPQAITGASD